MFRAVCDNTNPGDRFVITGNTPELGNWNPHNGLELKTKDGMFPNWLENTFIKAGSNVEYKFVIIRSNGFVEWESGANRIINLPTNGRAYVTNGVFGDTSNNWTPIEEK